MYVSHDSVSEAVDVVVVGESVLKCACILYFDERSSANTAYNRLAFHSLNLHFVIPCSLEVIFYY